MPTNETGWLLGGLLCLAVWPAHAFDQGGYAEAEPLHKR